MAPLRDGESGVVQAERDQRAARFRLNFLRAQG